MWHFIAGLIIVTVAVLGITLGSGCSKNQSQEKQLEALAPAEPGIPKTMSRVEIEARLRKLTKIPPPTKLSMGAMCYKMAGPPERIDYICPSCTQRTLYVREESRQSVWFLKKELDSCRRIVKEIHGIEVNLDETEFCKNCSPDAAEPKLCLVVQVKGEKPHRTRGVTADDLTVLGEFMSGKIIHKGGQDRELPLKNYTDRLETLLGIKVKL